MLGAVEFLRDQPPVPAEDRLGPYDAGHLLERLLAELGQRSPLAIGQAQTPFDLISKNAVLSCKILVAQEQFLVYRACDVSQQFLPVRRLSNLFGCEMD